MVNEGEGQQLVKTRQHEGPEPACMQSVQRHGGAHPRALQIFSSAVGELRRRICRALIAKRTHSHSTSVWLMAGSDAVQIVLKQHGWLWGDRLLSDVTVRLLVQPPPAAKAAVSQGSDGEQCCVQGS